jgi:hypothetical protein
MVSRLCLELEKRWEARDGNVLLVSQEHLPRRKAMELALAFEWEGPSKTFVSSESTDRYISTFQAFFHHINLHDQLD